MEMVVLLLFIPNKSNLNKPNIIGKNKKNNLLDNKHIYLDYSLYIKKKNRLELLAGFIDT
jgi:hypothetical protein